jgi:DNA repair protein RadC
MLTKADDRILHRAEAILKRLVVVRNLLNSPDVVRKYLQCKLATREHEVFVVLFLDNRHRLIESEEMFRGTIDGASVHPREIVKRALQHNAAAVLLAHNHPSGVSEPSNADELITRRLKDALALVDVRVVDHFIIAGSEIISFAERGLL